MTYRHPLPATRGTSAPIERLRSTLSEALLACTAVDSQGRSFACDVALRLSELDDARPRAPHWGRASLADLPALQHWPAAVANGRGRQPWVAALCGLLDELHAHLPWYRRPEPALPAFMAGHANAVLIGAGGLVESRRLLVGLSLMAPHTVYPDHHHPPAEGYVVLSDGQWRQRQGPWTTPGTGGWVYNPPDIVHAMRAGPQPLLAVWCLPLG